MNDRLPAADLRLASLSRRGFLRGVTLGVRPVRGLAAQALARVDADRVAGEGG